MNVKNITPGSKAAQSQMSQGDMVVAIDGVNTDGLTHLEAQNMIKSANYNLNLTLQKSKRPIPIPTSTPRIDSPMPVIPHQKDSVLEISGDGGSFSPLNSNSVGARNSILASNGAHAGYLSRQETSLSQSSSFLMSASFRSSMSSSQPVTPDLSPAKSDLGDVTNLKAGIKWSSEMNLNPVRVEKICPYSILWVITNPVTNTEYMERFNPNVLKDSALSTHKPIEVKGPGGKATIIHAQYNTPISMYSQDAIMDAIAGQAQAQGGEFAGNLPVKDPHVDSASPVYQAVLKTQNKSEDELDDWSRRSSNLQSKSFRVLAQMTGTEYMQDPDEDALRRSRERFETERNGPRFAKLRNWHHGLSAQILNVKG
ncbi:LIM domain binding 3 [Crotalus adamanteus]|uniref:LIM domain binding 3 n=1 Tax=Crotalus adamanteus TaxID=8729 RepID=A0AAW1BEX4_CROAD